MTTRELRGIRAMYCNNRSFAWPIYEIAGKVYGMKWTVPSVTDQQKKRTYGVLASLIKKGLVESYSSGIYMKTPHLKRFRLTPSGRQFAQALLADHEALRILNAQRPSDD